MGKTSNKAHDEWQARNYDRITIKVKKGDKEKLSSAARSAGVSVSRYIIESINSRSPGLLALLDDESKRKKVAEE